LDRNAFGSHVADVLFTPPFGERFRSLPLRPLLPPRRYGSLCKRNRPKNSTNPSFSGHMRDRGAPSSNIPVLLLRLPKPHMEGFFFPAWPSRMPFFHPSAALRFCFPQPRRVERLVRSSVVALLGRTPTPFSPCSAEFSFVRSHAGYVRGGVLRR